MILLKIPLWKSSLVELQELLVDRKVTEASCSTAISNPGGLGAQSTITLPYPISKTGIMAVVGRYDTGAYIDEQNFPTSAPSNGTAVSIRDAGGFHEDQANAKAGELIKLFAKSSPERKMIYEKRIRL